MEEDYLIEQERWYRNWVPEKLAKTCGEIGLDPSEVEYKLKTERDKNGWVNTRFTGWSKDWVFVIQYYDGWECIVAIPRNPVEEELLSEKIGGG